MSYSFFGIQVAFRNFKRDGLRKKLHEVLTQNTSLRQGVSDKQQFWKRFCALINEAMPAFEYGDWDLVRGSKAQEEFDTWVTEIEGSLATVAEELGDAADEVNRLANTPTYILATMMVLVEEDSNADRTIGTWCDIPEREWLTRQTFGQLVSIFPRLNFANVQADAVYLVPGDDRDGLSAEDLASPDYHHLQPLT
jgi:hypothetical protein